MNHYFAALKKYADFTGRASLSEYWYFVLFNVLIAVGLVILGSVVQLLMFLYFIYALAMLLPTIAVGVRRLHDTGKSGWWLCVAFVPFLGGLYLIYLLCQPSGSRSK